MNAEAPLTGSANAEVLSPGLLRTAATRPPTSHPAKFPQRHPWDRNAFLLFVGWIWLGVIMGFGLDIRRHIEIHAPPYPSFVLPHAVVFVGWLALLTAQVLLIRAHRPDIHRRLGIAGAVLAAVVILFGTAMTIAGSAALAQMPIAVRRGSASVMAADFFIMLGFAVLMSAALMLRRQPAAHKRLVLLASAYLSQPGFGRWMGFLGILPLLGGGATARVATIFLGTDLLGLGLGAYDLVTRKHLHPAYLAGFGFIAALQASTVWLVLQPWWLSVAEHLLPNLH